MFFDQKSFGARVRKQRKERDWTQEKLADQLYVGKQHISRIERGINAPSLDLVIDLSQALKVSADYLLIGKTYNCADIQAKLESIAEEIKKLSQTL